MKLISENRGESKDLSGLIAKIDEKLRSNYTSDDDDLEVQDRAQNYLQLINYAVNYSELEDGSNSLFTAHALNPVAAKAQKKVPVPTGLDLDQEFVIFADETINETIESETLGFASEQNGDEKKKSKKKKKRREKDVNDPNYLKSNKIKKGKSIDSDDKVASPEQTSAKKKKKSKKVEKAEVAEDVLISSQSALIEIPGLSSSSQFLTTKDGKKKKSKKKDGGEDVGANQGADDDAEEEDPGHRVTIRGLEMPEGVNLDADDDEEDDTARSDPHRALSKVVLDPMYGNRGDVITEKVIREPVNERLKGDAEAAKEKTKKKKKSKVDGEESSKKKKSKKRTKDTSSKVSNGDSNIGDIADGVAELNLNIPARAEYEETFERTPDTENDGKSIPELEESNRPPEEFATGSISGGNNWNVFRLIHLFNEQQIKSVNWLNN